MGTSFSRYPHYVRPLPPADSLPFPGNVICGCSDCGLKAGAKRPVPGKGPTPSDIMLIGQNPGKNEDEQGYPFVGQSGQYLNSLLFQCGIAKEDIYISNLVKCLSPNNRAPTAFEVSQCSKWLDIELELVQPKIIMAMGAPAITRFLGPNAGTVEHLHGKPVEVDGRIILPAYHPAAALRDTAKLRQCSEDFDVLRRLVNGEPWQSFHVVDEYPNPLYRVADTPEKLEEMRLEIEASGEFAVDTETCRGRLWSVQISAFPGTAWFIPIPEGFNGKFDLTKYDATAIVHFYLHDIQYLDIRDDKFVDNMVAAYLVGQAQGLKELASRLCGVPMQNYKEVVKSGQQRISLEYLRNAACRDWPDPLPIEETKWDNKKGCLITKQKKPWHIHRKIMKALDDYDKSPDTDLWERWQNIPEVERACVESVLNLMPESSLMDIPFEQALRYAARDADATLRCYHKLREIIAELDMDFILDMDLQILPMVRSMMDIGMAVDVDHLRELSGSFGKKMEAKATELAGIVGHPFNPNSSNQVSAVVYGELGFKPTKMTPSGEISTDDQELKKTKHPVAKGIIQYRGMQKLKSTYADALIVQAVPDDSGIPRVHTTLKTTRVETGRLSSSDPNLQNIPTRNKDSKDIKNGFVAPAGKILGEGDYGQIEMCTQAHLAKCKGLIELFVRGGDPHTETAAKLFGVPLEEAKKDKYRYPCKRAGFGIIYKIGPQGLMNQIQEYVADLEMAGETIDIGTWDESTCEKFIEDYYRLYPEIRDYQYEQVAFARRHGYVQDIFGRIRYIPEVFCPIQAIQEAGGRMAANMPVTSSAQGIIKLAMGRLWRELPRTVWVNQAKIIMQIHDSLLSEVPDDESTMKSYFRWKRDIMCGVVKLLVPVKVDFKVGKRWGELSKLSLEESK